MTRVIWTDRSRIEAHQLCERFRFLSYHEGPDHLGIAPARKPLALCVGGAVHRGLETLLRGSMDGSLALSIVKLEDAAVAAALADFSLHKSALALDTTETAAMTPAEGFDAQVAAQARELGMSADDPAVAELFQRQRNAAAEFDGWLFSEQAALVEGMVRAYARRRLRPLLEEFEVLEVEREGSWLLASWCANPPVVNTKEWFLNKEGEADTELMFMSRPDALLRSRADNSLYILSYKTAATWDIRKERDAQHDMQGLSEGVEVERRLGQWWTEIHQWDGLMQGASSVFMKLTRGCLPNTYAYLKELSAPPRILGIRYEYLLKFGRWEDKDLSARFGLKVWSQRSHLIRKYVATSVPARGPAAYSVGDECWSYDWIKDDGSTSKLAWTNWRARPVWEDGPGAVRAWIDKLDSTEMAMSAFDSTVGQEPREMGWKSEAQALGYTATHPLDDVFPAPLTVYRQDDQLRDFVEQIEASETRVAKAVAEVEAAGDEGERRHALNVHFPMSRRACEYPSSCAMVKLCFGGDDIRAQPLESGLYRVRTPHHTPELDATLAKEPR